MNKSLRFISISHQTATIEQREVFHIPEKEKSELLAAIRTTFVDISGLLLLVTCNRTEIYFESETTSASALRDFLIRVKASKSGTETKPLFNFGNETEDTVQHLLKVTSGLVSSVLGDAEIVHQIKKSYQFSIAHQLQGSLLERAMQTVFKSHKRISNETHFRDGTTSVAYKSLKVISDTFGKHSSKTKKILFIGAGEIVKQLFKYNTKFNFQNICISNRTNQKAKTLAKNHNCGTYDWRRVLDNDFKGFNVIISAASNCPQLVKQISENNDKVLLIDLAMPCNINKSLAFNTNIIFYDLDSISVDLEDTKEKRFDAIGEVTRILTEELDTYKEWLLKAPLRALLAKHKVLVEQKVVEYFDTNQQKAEPQDIKTVTDRVIRKLRKKTFRSITSREVVAAIEEQNVF